MDKSKPGIVTYRPEFKDAFRILNLEWIEKYFKVETKDLEQIENPEACISSGGQIFFAVVNQMAIGTCAAYKADGNTYEIAKMAVNPDYRGHGIGQLLMAAAEQWAKTQGATELFLFSNTVLEPAINLYKKHGYQVVKLGPHPDYERCNIEMRKQISRR